LNPWDRIAIGNDPRDEPLVAALRASAVMPNDPAPLNVAHRQIDIASAE
jgi:hypothetical protein